MLRKRINYLQNANELYITIQVIHNNPNYTLHSKLYNALNAKIHNYTSLYLYTQKQIYIHTFQVINLYFGIHNFNTQKPTYIIFQVINLYLHNLYTMTF